MSSLVISNFTTGLETDREPEFIDNKSFPTLENAYIWRGRIRKKRGTKLLGRLQRKVTAFVGPQIESPGGGAGTGNVTYNLFTALGINVSQPDAQLVLGNISNITITIGAPTSTVLTNTTGSSTMVVTGTTHVSAATINYATGNLVVTYTAAAALSDVTITIAYYPDLPVMGLEDFIPHGQTINNPTLVAMDTTYAYQFDQGLRQFFDVTFYKLTGHPFTFTGENYQQFWSVNFENAMWVTNNKPGFHFLDGTYTSGSGSTTVKFNFKSAGVDYPDLIEGDILFFNEWEDTIDLKTGRVSDDTDAVNGNYEVTFDVSVNVSGTGIAQMLTQSLPDQDGIRWYDGQPSSPSFANGWVNFAPPLQNTPTPQYLVGARMIAVFKDRLLFIGTWTATSDTLPGQEVYTRDQVAWCQNGTPFYSTLVPSGPTGDVSSDPAAWFQNVVGRGGFLNAGIAQNVVTVAENEDILLVGFEAKQTKLLYTNDDTLPFVFQTINSELGSQSTFSGIQLDTGAITIGDYGVALTTPNSAQRIDTVIPDAVFDISADSNSSERVCAIRDYRNEFIYFTYVPTDYESVVFPTQTLLYNYRDNTWGLLNEIYTHYGNFRESTSLTWSNLPYKTWADWNVPWNFGSISARFPNIIGGTPQGFVMIKGDLTLEDNSFFIKAISGLTITSPDHCLSNGDYIQISGATGDPGITAINGLIYQIFFDETDNDVFKLVPLRDQPTPSGTYTGGAVFKRFAQFQIQTKMFPTFWGENRQCRIGNQSYLLDTNNTVVPGGTLQPQITVEIFVDEDSEQPANDPEVAEYLPFSNVLLTCSEGESPAAISRDRTWHRQSNSFVGTTVQVGFTMSDAQMRDLNCNQGEVSIYAIGMKLYKGPILT